MKTSPQTPEWVIELMEKVCSDYNRALPGNLFWKPREGKHYSGGSTDYARGNRGEKRYTYVRSKNKKNVFARKVVFRGSISVDAGTDRQDQELVLLHELAHWVVVRNRAMGHTVRFWKKAFELYERYGIDMEYAFKREKNYKKTAITVYERYYKED